MKPFICHLVFNLLACLLPWVRSPSEQEMRYRERHKIGQNHQKYFVKVPNDSTDRAHCPRIGPHCTFVQEGRMFGHSVYLLIVQILAPSNRIPDCTFKTVGVNSWTKSMVSLNVLFVQIFAPPGRRGQCLDIEHV